MINKDLIEKYKKVQKLNNLLPIKVTDFYLEKIKEEVKVLWSFEWPLTRIIYPNEDKVKLHVWDEFKDWVDDRINMPKNLDWILIQKYENRVLLLSTQTCFSNCQYCFRQDILSQKDVNIIDDVKVNDIINYLNINVGISEVILSWWDPMILSSEKIDWLIWKIISSTKVRNFRIHTKSIVYSPDSISKEKIEILKKYNVRLVFHIVHPYEICDKVKEKINELNNNGIRLYNQFPLLRWINDDYNLLIKHIWILDDLKIRNLSIFIPDPVKFSACYRIPIKRIKKLIKNFNWNSSSWINSTRFLMDSNIWKIRIEDIIKIEWNKITFKRNSKEIVYFDFPEKLDKPWDLKIMLWKDYN